MIPGLGVYDPGIGVYATWMRNWGWELGIVIEDQDWELGLRIRIGIGITDWTLGLRIGHWD